MSSLKRGLIHVAPICSSFSFACTFPPLFLKISFCFPFSFALFSPGDRFSLSWRKPESSALLPSLPWLPFLDRKNHALLNSYHLYIHPANPQILGLNLLVWSASRSMLVIRVVIFLAQMGIVSVLSLGSPCLQILIEVAFFFPIFSFKIFEKCKIRWACSQWFLHIMSPVCGKPPSITAC